MCCLSKVSKVSNHNSWRGAAECSWAVGDGCAVGPSELMLGCVWAKNLELKSTRDFITLPETSHGWWRSDWSVIIDKQMPSDFFWMSFCKVLSLAWGLHWSSLLQSLFRVSTLIREEQVRCRCLGWEPTRSELQEGCVRGQPLQSFCNTGIPFLLLFAQGTGLLLGATVPVREERLCKPDFLPHLDSEMSFVSFHVLWFQ